MIPLLPILNTVVTIRLKNAQRHFRAGVTYLLATPFALALSFLADAQSPHDVPPLLGLFAMALSLSTLVLPLFAAFHGFMSILNGQRWGMFLLAVAVLVELLWGGTILLPLLAKPLERL